MAKLVVDEEIGNSWARITADKSEISWIMFGYPENNANQLIFKGEGSGGMPEFIQNFPENDIVWGAFKVVGVDDRGNLKSRRPKYIFVKWMPADVPPLKRAKTGAHKGALKQIINSHIDIEIETKDELTEDVIIAKLRASGGAHQPTGYEFSNYSTD